MLQIIQADPADARAMAHVCQTSWKERYVSFMPSRPMQLDTMPALTAWIRAMLLQANGGAFLAVLDKKIIGVLIYQCWPGKIEARQLFVLPQYQGVGAGTALFARFRHLATTRSAKIWLDAARDNISARGWYEKEGGTSSRFTKIRWNGYVLPMLRYIWR